MEVLGFFDGKKCGVPSSGSFPGFVLPTYPLTLTCHLSLAISLAQERLTERLFLGSA